MILPPPARSFSSRESISEAERIIKELQSRNYLRQEQLKTKEQRQELTRLVAEYLQTHADNSWRRAVHDLDFSAFSDAIISEPIYR